MKKFYEMFGTRLMVVNDDGSGKNCETCFFGDEFGKCRYVDKTPCLDENGESYRHFVKECK